MKSIPIVLMLIRPHVVREVALERAEYATVMINTLSGLFIVAAFFLPWLPLFTGSLVAVLSVLFGPLAGFTISSLYSRVEWTVGKRLGGKASHGELYRFFAWSFLQMGSAVLFYALILISLDKPPVVIELAASIPSLVIVFCAIRNYCSNITASQQFTRTRGAISLIVTLLLFFVLISGGGAGLSLIFEYGLDDSLKSLFVQP